MIGYTICRNSFLKKDICAFAHEKYVSGDGRHKLNGTVENLIVSLKNEHKNSVSTPHFQGLMNKLAQILRIDLPSVFKQSNFLNSAYVVTVPRSKANFGVDQLLFYSTTSNTVNSLGQPFHNGTSFITRVKNTATTHKSGWQNVIDNDPMPYVGITKDTCKLSNSIAGKNIILIDDLYTPGKNIDEDALQALFDYGAKNIVFYSVGAIVPEVF